MDFDFTDDQNALRDAVQRWVARDFGFERRHALARAGGASREVYTELAALGLAALAIAPEHGGMGFGAVEAMVVMEELGRGLVHAPVADAALIAPALLARAPAAVQAAWLPRIADGSALVIPALFERVARYRLDQVDTAAEPSASGAQGGAGGWLLTGAKSMVAAGDEADAFVVPAAVAGRGVGLFLVEAGAHGVDRRQAYPTQDGARAVELKLAGATATLLVEDAAEALALARDIGIAAACAEGVGLMDRLVAETVAYMNQRKQFGVPIASFQALRHRMADVKMQLELGRSMSYFASLKLGEPAAARARALSQAKVQLGHSMRFVGQQCVQLHGGIGITDEYIGSHLFKRLTMLEMAHGDTLHHLGVVSERMGDTAGVFV